MCCTYVTPSNSTVINTESFDFFEEIESGIERYETKGKCFIFGDLNSRTASVSDTLDYDEYIEQDIQLPNYVNIPTRVSKDRIVDNLGRRLIELCQSTSYIIGNGRLHNDKGIGD